MGNEERNRVCVPLIPETNILEIQILTDTERKKDKQMVYWWNRLKTSMTSLVTSQHFVFWADLLKYQSPTMPPYQFCFPEMAWPAAEDTYIWFSEILSSNILSSKTIQEVWSLSRSCSLADLKNSRHLSQGLWFLIPLVWTDTCNRVWKCNSLGTITYRNINPVRQIPKE